MQKYSIHVTCINKKERLKFELRSKFNLRFWSPSNSKQKQSISFPQITVRYRIKSKFYFLRLFTISHSSSPSFKFQSSRLTSTTTNQNIDVLINLLPVPFRKFSNELSSSSSSHLPSPLSLCFLRTSCAVFAISRTSAALPNFAQKFPRRRTRLSQTKATSRGWRKPAAIPSLSFYFYWPSLSDAIACPWNVSGSFLSLMERENRSSNSQNPLPSRLDQGLVDKS